MELTEFMTWLGSGVGALMAFSFLAELSPAWQNLPAKNKRFWSKLGAVVIALLAFLVLNFVPVETIALIDPYFKVIVGVLVMDAGAQGFHQVSKK